MLTRYELYLFDTSAAHRAVAKFSSATPFPSVAVGDRFDDHGWDRCDGVGRIASETSPIRYLVHSKKHTLLEQDGVLRIQTWLNLSPYAGAKSPVWGEC